MTPEERARIDCLYEALGAAMHVAVNGRQPLQVEQPEHEEFLAFAKKTLEKETAIRARGDKPESEVKEDED